MFWIELRLMLRKLLARNPLLAAFLLSLVFHGTAFEGWKLGKRLGWWDHQATWLLNLGKKLHPRQLQPALPLVNQPPPQREIPLSFAEVDPALATPEPPKDAKFYGAQNSRAANSDPVVEAVVPKAEGQQTKLVRLEDVPKPQPLQPSPPPEKAHDPVPQKSKAKPPGDLAKLKTDQTKKQDREKPRTLAQARQQKSMLAGEQMKQEGGVNQRGKLSLDVKATPFGAYDYMLIAAVQQRWYDLLDNTQFAQRAGKVILEFRLYYDGRITDMKVAGNDVGELLALICQRAVLDPSPFAPWPSDMRRAVGKNYRDVMFTFYYY